MSSFTLTEAEFADVAALKRRVLVPPDDELDDDLAHDCLREASRLVQEECGRVFTVDSGPHHYWYDAPDSDLLFIADLTDATPIEINLGGQPLATSDYLLLADDPHSPYNLTDLAPCWTAVRRLVDGQPANWDAAALADGRSPQRDVEVIGTGGYAAAVVADVVGTFIPTALRDATLRGAVRRWHAQSIQEGEGGGTSETGTTPAPFQLLDRVALELLGPFVHRRKPGRKRGGAR